MNERHGGVVGSGAEKVFPASPAQKGLWFFDQLAPGSPAYNMFSALALDGPLDASALGRSLDEIVRRHDALRTTFAFSGGQPVQVVTPHLPGVRGGTSILETVNLESLPDEDRDRELGRLATLVAREPFDLAAGPLVRATLVRLRTDRHVLLHAMHHAVSDGWSLGVFHREMSQLYGAFSRGESSPLAPLPLQLSDHVLREAEADASGADALEAAVAAATSRLEGAPLVLALPSDRRRPDRPSYLGDRVRVDLSEPLLEAVEALSLRTGVTSFMTLLAAFEVLLARYTGVQDLVVGTPVANRGREDVQGLIGLLVNPVVLRADLGGDPTFLGLLDRTLEETMAALEHRGLPFDQLVEHLHPERDGGRHPVVQVMFAFQKSLAALPELEGLKTSLLEHGAGTSRLDLTLTLTGEAEPASGWMHYSTDLFERATVERMVGHYRTLLEGAVAAPDTRISRLPLLTGRERRQVLVEWNDTRVDYPPGRFAHDLVSEQAGRTPDAIALRLVSTAQGGSRGPGSDLSYARLEARSNQVARLLQARGVGPEVPVGVCLERGLESVVGLLGVLKAGGAWLPLDPANPKDRLAWMLEDAAVPVVLTESRLEGALPPHGARTLCLDRDSEELTRQDETPPASGLRPENLAYIVFTSGSTGRPKGVMVEHRGLYSYVATQQQDLREVVPGAAVLHAFPFSFDAAIAHAFAALCAGATLCVTDGRTALSGESLGPILRREEIVLAALTPSVLAELDPAGLPALRTITVGGEACPPDLVERWALGRRLLNRYGPTEGTMCATTCELRPGSDRPSIGRPLANTRVYILDPCLQPVPVGVAGEIVIGGTGVARGYLKDPELTAELFVPDPFAREGGGRVFRTGDLGRFLADGRIEFLGRMDEQVKIRGYRIEPGEVEAALRRHRAVADCVVVPWQGPSGMTLAAYVVSAPDEVAGRAELGRFLRAALPLPMIPSAYVAIDHVPRLPNGKVDRRRLPAPSSDREPVDREAVPPQGAVEEVVAEVVAAVLGVPMVGRDDDFFGLGGHSLLATQVVSRLELVFRTEVPLRIVFERPTVAELAWALIEGESQAGRAEQIAAAYQKVKMMSPDERKSVIRAHREGS